MGEKVEIVYRYEEHFACGCSTVRIEHDMNSELEPRVCSGHGDSLVKSIATTEYTPAHTSRLTELREAN